MHALDLVAQTVNIGKLFLPSYYWGCYFKMLRFVPWRAKDMTVNQIYSL